MIGSKVDEWPTDLEAAQAAVLARFAPDARVRRIEWSRGGTQVVELGEGPPLLLVHGAFNSVHSWLPIVPSLARRHRVLAVDSPGHGLADPFDYDGVDLMEQARTFLRDVLDALGLHTVALVGNSFGGFFSVAFALDAPDRVSQLALVGAPAGVARWVPLPLKILALPVVGQRLGRRMMTTTTRESDRKLWGQMVVAHPERVDDALLDADIASMRRNFDSHMSFLRGVRSPRGLRRGLVFGERWSDLRVPTMFVCGDRDAFAPARVMREWDAIAARNPNVRVTRLPDAGHLPWIDEPDRVVDEIERFLASSGER